MAMCAEELATARAAFGASAWVKEMEADGTLEAQAGVYPIF